MAKKVTLQVDVDSTGAVLGINKVENKLEDVAKKSGEATAKSSKKFSEMAGNILKSLGALTVLITAFEKIKEAITGTQRGADLFNTVMGTISTILRDFVNFIFDNFGKVVDFFKQVFENPIESIKKLGDLIKENLIERFNSLLDTFGYLGESLSKLFSGDFSGAWESVKKAGKESIDIITGVNNTVDRTVEAVTDAANAIADYTKSVYDQNKAMVQAENNAKIAAAQALRVKEQKDREAEQLRQIRDEERNTIADRIKANNDLKSVLDEQEKSMLKLANTNIYAAQLALQNNKTVDNQVRLTQALAEKEGVLATVAGLRSEQKANDLALNRELNDMLKAQAQNVNELAVNDKKFTAEMIMNSLDRLKAQKEVFEAESQLTLKRLQDNINLYKVGTQARVDAENEYNLKKQEIDQNIQLKDKEIREAEIIRLNELQQAKLNLIYNTFEREKTQLELESAERIRLAYGDSEKIQAIEKDKATKLRAIRKEQLLKELQMTSDGLGALMSLNDSFSKKDEKAAKKRFEMNKALAIAQATINTFMAVNAALTAGGNPLKLATGMQFVEAGIALATGIANVIKIEQTKFEPGSTSGAGAVESNLGSFTQGGGGAPGGLTAQNTVTQLNPDGTVAGQSNQQPMKAYVVESESRAVTDRINKLSNNSKIG